MIARNLRGIRHNCKFSCGQYMTVASELAKLLATFFDTERSGASRAKSGGLLITPSLDGSSLNNAVRLSSYYTPKLSMASLALWMLR